MTDSEAQIALIREFPEWLVCRGTSGLPAARWHSRPGVTVTGEDWADLRDEIIAAIWKAQP
ncbi:MAG: hypothetical protein ACREQ5_19695 [Candidatus Dormibacteria bacterium]